ncbi:MAG: Cna B-type domain-containing protein, partial [Clostridia bacterium]|nr:Cna B-type domain-containing protein [Clostridia bacterium]
MLNKRLRVVTAFVLTVFMLFSHFSDWYAVSWENSVTSPSPSKTTYEQSTYPDESLETCDPNETDPPGGLSGTDAPAPTPSHAPHSTPNQSLTKPDDIPSATPVVTESPSPEPKHTASPPMDNLDANQPSDESKNERYTDKDTFQIRVTVNGTPPSTDDAGELGPVLEPLCIEAALEYQTEDHTWQIVDKEWAAVNGAERTEPYDIQFFITAGNRASASVSMKNLPVRYAYRARLIAINGINADTLRQYGMTVAYFDRPLLTRVTLRWRDMVNKEAADEPMLLEKPQMDADDEPTLSEGPPAHPFIQEPTGMASFNLPVLDNQPEQSDLFPSILAASALFQAVDVTIRLYLNYSDNDEDAAVTIIPLSINDDEPEVSLTVPCAGNPSISYAITLTADENDHIVYTVRINALYHIISSADKISGEVNPDGTVDVTFSAVEKTALTFKKHWYDNNDVRSRYDVTLRLQAKQISKEGAGWYDTGDKYELNGDMLEYDPYSDTFSDLPLYDAEGYRLAYRVIEAESDSVNAKLYIQSRLNNGEIINTKKTSLTVYKVWKDAATYGETRPSFEDWRSGIQLIRIAYDDSIEIVDAFTVSTSDETLSTWELMIDNLPAYDETGYAYTYYIEEQTDGWKDCDAIGSYETAHQNKNEFRDKTSGIYNGGSSVSTMVNDMVFTFKKTWKDGDGANRPQLTYKLYRVIIDPDNPEGTVPSIITASPVPKMDTMIIPGGSDIDFNEFITYTGAGGIQLPMYDQDGRQYLYFAVENLSGNTVDYVIEIDNGGPYLFNTGEITNRKKANYTPSVRKRWYASAIQSMDASCTFSLQRNEGVLNDDGIRIPDWQTCGDMTITGFTAEMLDKSGSFSGDYPKYDADGYPYEYRVVESGAVINGETAVGDFEIGGVFSAYGYSFRISEANGVFYNTLIGETSFGVRKVWSPASTWESESNPSITIEILQNGTPYRLNPEDLPVIDGMSVSVNNTSITLTMTDFDKETDSPNFTAVFDNLPKYTATGGLYEYNVREISCTSGYIHKSTGYTIEGTVPTGVLTNIAGGEGPTLVFYVSKQWLDDSDQDLRRPVTMTLFFLNEDDVYEPVRDIQLSVGNSWYQEYYYAPNDSDDMSAREWQYDNYLIRETKVGESEVIYNTYSDFLAGIGRITDYNQQLYSCTHIKTATNGYRAINLRYGTLSVIVDKSWAVGEITGLVSEFTVYGNGDAVEKLELPQGTASVTFDNLPKYDDQGVIISYTLRETGLKKAGDAVFTLISGGAVYLVDVGMVSHSIAEGAYVIGSQRTNDTMSYSVSNIRTESNNLTVNKVWRDENENAPRPDIALSLSRKSTKPGAPEQTLGGDRVWNTGTNQWLWTCDFGNMPKYDAEGYLYEYYVRETILQSGSYYHISYNNEGILPNVNGTTSEAVYAAFSDGSSYARAEFKGSEIKPGTEPGIIINTIARDMSIPGSKYWLNYPAWFNPVHFPTVYIHLYCMPKPDYEAMMADNPESMYDSEYHINQVELVNGARGFEFEDLPQYTEYGVPYVYYLLETQDAEGQNDTPVQGYYVDYSKTDLSVYNIYDNDPASMAYVKITVFKNWRWPEKDTDQLRYPNVTFDLYRQWMIDEKILYSEQVDTITLTGGIIEDYEDGKHWYTFGQDASLPYFAPDGTVYEYIVKERAINGYQNTEMTPTDGKVRLEKEDNRLYSGTVSFTNAYTPNSPDPCVLTAYKVWNDESNAYGTRPDIGDAQEALGYSLWRRTASISEEKLDKINFNWAQDSAPNNNRWVATISTSTDSGFSFPKYATTGESYTYFVKEELAAPYKDAYVLSSGSGTLSLTNTLKTCQVSANKQWKDGEAPLSAAQLADLTHFGLPTTLRFAVQYRFEDEEWRPYLLIDSSPLNRDVSAEELFSGGTISFTNWLPLYREKDGKPVRVQYRVCETEMSFDNGDSFVTVIYDNGDAPESVPGEDLRMMTVKQEDFLFGDANGNGTHTSTISNNLSVQKLYFVKIWDDDGNRDGRRPDEIIFSISQDNSTYGRDISLTKDTLSDQSTGSSDKDNTWYAECWATVYIEPGEAAVYTVTEECPAFYAQSYETFDSKTLTWTFTNEAAIDVVTLQAQKAWAGETPWTVRPDSVLLTLEQKDGDGDAWRPTESSDLPTGVSSFVNPVEVTYKAGIEKWADIAVEVWKDIASWSGLPVHQLREDPTDDPVPIYYRVSEEDTAMGYISVSTVVVPMEYKDDESTEIPVIILTNTLETVQLTGSKIWDDSDDWYKRRPKLDAESGDPNITLTVLADDTEMNPQPEIVWTSSTYITEPLPKYAYNSDKIVVYAVQETPIPVEYEAKYGLSTSNKYQTDITNTLETTSVSGKKTWSDNANHYLYRPEILELKVYIEDSEEPMDIQPKATDIIWDKPEGTDEWIYTIVNLPKYIESGAQIARYVVREEIPLGGYALQNAETAGNGSWNELTGQVTEANFTNTLETISITGSKKWEDESNKYGTRPEPEDFKLTVYQNNVLLVPQPAEDDIEWVETDTDVWHYTIVNLPKKMKDSNSDAQYIIRESFHHGYDASHDIVKDDSGKITEVNIINTLITIPLTVTKVWDDYSNYYDTRPDGLALTVYADNKVMIPQPDMKWSKDLDSEGIWSLKVTGLPRYNKITGKPIVYLVEEATLEPSYASDADDGVCQADLVTEATIEDYLAASFTNTLKMVSISGTKTWDDDDNHYGHRPAELVLTVLANGDPLQRPKEGPDDETEYWTFIVQSGDDDFSKPWSYLIEGLPMYIGIGNEPVVYSVREAVPNGYSTDNEELEPSPAGVPDIMDANFTNTLETTSISGKKFWNDNGNHYLYRPEILELKVYIEDSEEPIDIQPKTTDIIWDKPEGTDEWIYTIIGLPKYLKGSNQIARYVVQEEVPSGGYIPTSAIGDWDEVTGEVTEADFTNILETISITGSKTWED